MCLPLANVRIWPNVSPLFITDIRWNSYNYATQLSIVYCTVCAFYLRKNIHSPVTVKIHCPRGLAPKILKDL